MPNPKNAELAALKRIEKLEARVVELERCIQPVLTENVCANPIRFKVDIQGGPVLIDYAERYGTCGSST